MDDAVTRYCEASSKGELEAMAATFADDVQLPSPLVGRMTFKGRDVLGILTAVYSVLRRLEWEAPVGEGATRLAIAHATVLGMRIDGHAHR